MELVAGFFNPVEFVPQLERLIPQLAPHLKQIFHIVAGFSLLHWLYDNPILALVAFAVALAVVGIVVWRAWALSSALVWLELVGETTRILIYVAVGAVFFEAGIVITNRGTLTFLDVLGLVFCGGGAFSLCYFLFHPSGKPERRRAWGLVGVLIVAGAGIWYTVLHQHF
jgi:hypothetical protein